MTTDKKDKSVPRRKPVPSGFWTVKENRVRAVEALVRKLGKPPNNILRKDFIEGGLGGLVATEGPHRGLLKEAGFAVPSDGKKTRKQKGYWTNKKNRVKAVRGLVEELSLPPSYIGQKEFAEKGISSLLIYYNNSPSAALEDAGYVLEYHGMNKKRYVPRGYWKRKEHRVAATRWLVEHTGNDPTKVTGRDFERGKLQSLLHYCNFSPREALKEAGYRVPPRPRAPAHYWDDHERRVKAIRMMVKLCKKPPEKITNKTFSAFHLSGILSTYYGSSIYRALWDAGCKVEPKVWQRPHGFWDVKENRIAATQDLVNSSKKALKDIIWNDFVEAGIVSVVIKCGSVTKALREAGYDLKIWELRRVPSKHWQSKENRVVATRRFVETLRKEPSEITGCDFKTNHLLGLLEAYGDELCASYEMGEMFTYDPGYLLSYPTRAVRALVEAGFQFEQNPFGEGYRRRRGGFYGYWKIKENRIKTLRALLKDVGNPRKLRARHFEECGVKGLLLYYNHSINDALREIGHHIQPWEQAKVPRGYWKVRDNRVKATRWLIEKLDGDAHKVKKSDFLKEGLLGLIRASGGVTRALKEAGYELKPWKSAFVPPGTWDSKENRVAAVKWLLAKTKKGSSKITRQDFFDADLGGLLHKGGGLYRVLTEAGYEIKSRQGAEEKNAR